MQPVTEKTMDRISSLPDEILCHILSFVPSIDSIQTSILSKRFRYLWRSVPVLDFMDIICPKDKLEKLVDNALSSHEDLSTVRKFFLRCYISKYSQTTISKWINSATACASNLEELDLYVRQKPNVYLPSAFFSCQRLKSLGLAGDIIIHNIPPDLFFPSLKTIKFMSISIVDDNPLDKLFSAACPKLEILHLVDFSMNIFPGRDKTKLYLNFFKAYWTQGGCQNNMLSPDSASINVKFLKQLELFHTDMFEIVKFRGRHGTRPVFEHLTHLVVGVGRKYFFALPILLEHSPNLTFLVLERSGPSEYFSELSSSVYEEYSHRWDAPPTVFKCLVCNLETVEIKEFNGIREMEVVKYFLNNALVLRKLDDECVQRLLSRCLVIEVLDL
ncbi:hypothetical protein DITRI_Ditri01bG0151300 [Diplodiscus trichospermus]